MRGTTCSIKVEEGDSNETTNVEVPTLQCSMQNLPMQNPPIPASPCLREKRQLVIEVIRSTPSTTYLRWNRL
jgi:hypothetical protein